MSSSQVPLEKIDDYRWRIPKTYKPGMRVPGIIYADEKLLKDIRHDKALEQVANVAFLPGIVNASLAMPDISSIGSIVPTSLLACIMLIKMVLSVIAFFNSSTLTMPYSSTPT